MQGLVPRMIEEVVQLAIDPILKPRCKPNDSDEKGFELIYREETGS